MRRSGARFGLLTRDHPLLIRDDRSRTTRPVQQATFGSGGKLGRSDYIDRNRRQPEISTEDGDRIVNRAENAES